MIRRAWATWVDLTRLREPPHVLAVVRILIPCVLLFDLGYVAAHDLVTTLWAPDTAGGLAHLADRNPMPELYRWFPQTAETAHAAFTVLVGLLVCVALGVATPVTALAAALVYAQLNMVLPLADRGIDSLIRNVLVLLAFAPSGRAWSVDAWVARRLGRPFAAEQPAWGRHLLILQLAGMYFLAGVQKTALAWTPLGGFSALYSILQDPSIAAHPFGWLADFYPATQLASATTMVFEYTACLVPLVYWFRHTRDRPGRMRAWFNRWRPLRVWVLLGLGLHVGIAATMSLGIFPYAMLALYPALFHPDEWRSMLGRGGGDR